MSNKNELFCSYVMRFCGGSRAEAARRIGKSIQTVGHIINGLRNVTPEIAMRIDSDTAGMINKADFRPDLWSEQKTS